MSECMCVHSRSLDLLLWRAFLVFSFLFIFFNCISVAVASCRYIYLLSSLGRVNTIKHTRSGNNDDADATTNSGQMSEPILSLRLAFGTHFTISNW